MGNSSSLLPEDKLDEYLEYTYLNKLEIETLFKKFCQFSSTENVLEERIHVLHILEMIPQIKYNIFCDRILRVFSSKSDGCFSFEDLLDYFSVMSKNCPTYVKARWAYRLFEMCEIFADFDDDLEITRADVSKLFDRLTKSGSGGGTIISLIDKNHIVDVLVKAMDVENNGSIGKGEFEHALSSSTEFKSAFTFSVYQ